MTVIGIDIDDTLFSFGDLAREVMCDLAVERDDKVLQRGAYAAWNEWRTPPDIIGMEAWQEVISICHSPENILSRIPFPNASEILTELFYHGNELLYISNRAENTFNFTVKWLEVNKFPNGTLLCTTKSKSEYLKDCQYLIDDRPKTLVEFVYDPAWANDRVAFGLHKEYNSSLTDVPGIYLAPNWKLLSKFLVKERLLESNLLSAV